MPYMVNQQLNQITIVEVYMYLRNHMMLEIYLFDISYR